MPRRFNTVGRWAEVEEERESRTDREPLEAVEPPKKLRSRGQKRRMRRAISGPSISSSSAAPPATPLPVVVWQLRDIRWRAAVRFDTNTVYKWRRGKRNLLIIRTPLSVRIDKPIEPGAMILALCGVQKMKMKERWTQESGFHLMGSISAYAL